MKKEISTYQICILIFISMLTLKLLSLPSYFYISTKNSGFLTLIFYLCCDFVMFLLFYFLKKRNPDKKFFEVICVNFGKIIAKIVFFCVFLMFFIKFMLIMWESYSYFRETIFSKAPFYFYFVLLVTTSSSIVLFGLKSFSRTAEFVFYLIFFGLFGILLVVIFTGNFSSISPIFNNVQVANFMDSLKYIAWFGDPIFLYLLIDKFDIDKNSLKKLSKSILISFVFLILLFVIFYKIYTVTSPNHRNAIMDIVRISKRKSTVNMLDWIPVITMMFLIVMQSSLYCFCLKNCYCQGSGDDNTNRFIFIFVSLLLIVNFLFPCNLQILVNLSTNYFSYLALFVFYVFPILLSACDYYKFKRRKENEIISKII